MGLLQKGSHGICVQGPWPHASICRGSAPGWTGRSVCLRELPHTAMAAAPCNLPGMWVPTSAWHLGPFAVPIPTAVWPCLLGFTLHPADDGHRGASACGRTCCACVFLCEESVPTSRLRFTGRTSAESSYVWTHLLCRRVSQPELTFLFC